MNTLLFLAHWNWFVTCVMLGSGVLGAFVFPFLFKRWLLDRFDSEYQKFIERFTPRHGDMFRVVLYCRELVAPIYSKYTDRPMNKVANRREKLAALAVGGCLMLCLVCVILDTIPFLTERLGFADLGMGFFHTGQRRGTGLVARRADLQYDYLYYVIHSPLRIQVVHWVLILGKWFLLWLYFVRRPLPQQVAFRKLKQEFKRRRQMYSLASVATQSRRL